MEGWAEFQTERTGDTFLRDPADGRAPVWRELRAGSEQARGRLGGRAGPCAQEGACHAAGAALLRAAVHINIGLSDLCRGADLVILSEQEAFLYYLCNSIIYDD